MALSKLCFKSYGERHQPLGPAPHEPGYVICHYCGQVPHMQEATEETMRDIHPLTWVADAYRIVEWP